MIRIIWLSKQYIKIDLKSIYNGESILNWCIVDTGQYMTFVSYPIILFFMIQFDVSYMKYWFVVEVRE